MKSTWTLHCWGDSSQRPYSECPFLQVQEERGENRVWAERKKISGAGLISLKLTLVEDFIKICDLKLRIRTNNISWWGMCFCCHT